ncbi:hsp70 family protein [Candidatus Protochlamydia amoebophila]|nr:hsp70 family protein [Candidatus Protochlamydia amoebophila]
MRYIIGIDLGTTNSAISFIDTLKPYWSIELFSISQLTAPGKIESLSTLPSFCYLLSTNEWPEGALRLPWKEEKFSVVGQFAKLEGARVPTKLVQSAKSWLCHVAANRQDKILPIEAADPLQRISPVEACAKYLAHLKEAWNQSFAREDHSSEFEEQEIILTVPASFDEVARTLTIEAARLAGLRHVTLLEEPQAAFYSWISQNEKQWKEIFSAGETILVCDVGGGTTDFSLIEIQEKGKELFFQRRSVGDHLLLGGDNMDSALAHYLEQKFQAQGFSNLESTQWLQLLAEARFAKEALLDTKQVKESYTVTLQGSGSSVIKGSMSASLTRGELQQYLLKGFFNFLNLEEALKFNKTKGIRTVGLPYEDEPSILKHLARFLQQANYFQTNKRINYILFNGGVLKPILFQQAIIDALAQWFSSSPPSVLVSASLDLAVAKGAAYYAKARRGQGVSIRGGLPRTYYLEIDVKDAQGKIVKKALTLLARGAEEGAVFKPSQTFFLRTNTPVCFHLLTSHMRLNDKEGDQILIDEQEMHRLPLIQTVLRYGKKQTENEEIPACLNIHLTPIGTLELWLESQKTEHRWHLEFQLRSVSGQEDSLQFIDKIRKDETFDTTYLKLASKILEEFFMGTSSIKSSQLIEKLENQLGIERKDWSLSILRELWNPLLKCAANRKLSQEYETRWWNLAGFFLRPGFGFPLDDFRIKELWKIILSDFKSSKTQEVLIQKWICFRRIAGGLNKGQQMQIASDLIETLVDKKSGQLNCKRKNEVYAYSEKIRAFAALERIELSLKHRLGNLILQRFVRGEEEICDYWALSRIGTRNLIYGSAGQVISKDIVEKWIELLLKITPKDPFQYLFLLEQLAKKTNQRELNVSETLIQKLIKKFPDVDLTHRLSSERIFSQIEKDRLFGDQLPSGILLEELKSDLEH